MRAMMIRKLYKCNMNTNIIICKSIQRLINTRLNMTPFFILDVKPIK